MQSPDQKPNTIAEDIEEERLRVWREKRAKVAEASRQERIKIAEAERRERLKAFEADKAERIRQAAEKRAQEQAAKHAERMAVARSKIAGRTDIEAARKRLHSYRNAAARKLAVRLAACVICPTALVAAYLFGMATPLYSSHAQFAITPPAVEANLSQSAFEATQLSRETQVLREVMLSPRTLTALNQDNGFAAHFNSQDIDPLTRLSFSSPTASEDAVLNRFVSVAVNGQDGLVQIETKAADPETAQAFGQTVLKTATAWLADGAQSQSDVIRLVTPPTLATDSNVSSRLSTLLLCFVSFLALYAIASIFGRTLLRHSEH